MNAKSWVLWGIALTMGINHSFAQWTQVSGLSSENVMAITIKSIDTMFVGTDDYGVYRSTDGGSNWAIVLGYQTYNVQSVYSLALAPSGDVYAGTFSVGLLRTTDGGHSWGFLSGGSGDLPEEDTYAVAVNASGTVFAADYGDVYRSTDAGNSWTEVKSTAYVGSAGFRSIAFGGTDTVYICGTGDSFRASTDNGSTWPIFGTGLNSAPYVLAVNSKGTLFAGTRGGGVFKSTDGGRDWTAENTNLTNSYINALAINPAGIIFAGTSTGVFISSDNGSTWTADISGLTHLDIRSFAFDPLGKGYAGAYTSGENGGLWRSNAILPIELTSFTANETGDATVLQWTTLCEIHCYGFNVQKSPDGKSGWVDLGFIPGNGTTLAAHCYIYTDTVAPFTYYRLEQIDLDGEKHYSNVISLSMTDVATIANMPNGFRLEQNFPNPFNPSTTIRYGLPYRSDVTLTVYNTLGQKLATLARGVQEAGYHDVKFDGSNLASGVYFYRIQAGSFLQTKRLSLLK